MAGACDLLIYEGKNEVADDAKSRFSLQKNVRTIMFVPLLYLVPYTYNLCTASVVQEVGGCLTKKNASQCKAILPQGEAVFVDYVSLLVIFSYFFLLFVTFINYFLLGQEGQGKPFISFIHCSGGRGVP